MLTLTLLSSLIPAYKAVDTLLSEDHRLEPPYWELVGQKVPEGGKVLGLVQQYGHLLMYYGGVDVKLWPVSGELYLAELRGNPNVDDFEALFADKTEGMDYFLVTASNQFEWQEELASYLYENYPVYLDEPNILIFDLRED